MKNKREKAIQDQGYGYIITIFADYIGKLYWTGKFFNDRFHESYFYKTEAGAKKAKKRLPTEYGKMTISKVTYDKSWGWIKC